MPRRSKYDPEMSATQKVDIRALDQLGESGKHTFGTVGGYVLKGILGKGGSAIVYRARRPDSIDMALKVFVRKTKSYDEKFTRFVREAQAVSILREHPNIITVYDVGTDVDSHYIAMELVPDGRTLKDILDERQQLERHEALGLGISICKALAYAHKQGFVHRDVKPQNILISEFGEPLLSDFGLVYAGDSDVTKVGQLVGTPSYIAPEQLKSDSRDPGEQADIYSFGVMLYRMVTGRLPFGIEHDMGLAEILDRIENRRTISPSAYGSKLGNDLEAIVLKCLERDPEDRYKSSGALLHELEACRAGRPVHAAIPDMGQKFERWVKRHKITALAVLAGILAVAAVYVHFRERVNDMLNEQVALEAQALSESRALENERDRLESLFGSGDQAGETAAQKQMLLAQAELKKPNFGSAQKQYEKALATALEDGDRQVMYMARAALSRLNMAAGNYDDARAEFLAIAASQRQHSFVWELCAFEAGVCGWLKGDKAAAKQAWEILSPAARGKVETDAPVSYITTLSGLLLNRCPAGDVEEAMKDVSKSFQAIGYWSLAQTQPSEEGSKRNELMRKAQACGGSIFIWIRVEE